MYVANHLEGVKAVICMTATGFAPLIMSRITSSLPIYAMAEKHGTCEITALYKGVSTSAISRFRARPIRG